MRPLANVVLGVVGKLVNRFIVDMDDEQKEKIVVGLIGIASDVVSQSVAKTVTELKDS